MSSRPWKRKCCRVLTSKIDKHALAIYTANFGGKNIYGDIRKISASEIPELDILIVKGYPKREWQKTLDRNKALDCRIYARAAAIALGIDRWTDTKWEQISGVKSKQTENTLSAKKPRPKIIKSKWL